MGGGEILVGAASGALVVASGALYALFFALGRLGRVRAFAAAAWVAYGILVLATLALARTLDLGGAWRAVVVVMLVGYLLAPHAIWHLSVATHRAERDDSGSA